jgi:hypothetical protein
MGLTLNSKRLLALALVGLGVPVESIVPDLGSPIVSCCL